MTSPLDRIGPVSDPPTLLEMEGILRSWRNMDYEDVASLFHAETGHLRPGKDVAAHAFAQEPNEVRAAAFWAWCHEKNETISTLLGIATENAERRAATAAEDKT